MRHGLLPALFLLQLFQVLHLLLHDWVPLGTLNKPAAVRAENPGAKLWLATVLTAAPFAVPLAGSAMHLHGPYPGWLVRWIGIACGILLLGELQAWWVPYLRGTTPERAARYRAMFGGTHAFVPERNGVVVNTLHTVLHLATVTTLLVLLVYVEGW